MARQQLPAMEGWFTTGEEPCLLGTRCSSTGTFFFPPEHTMSRAPGAGDSTLSLVELSRRGTLWSYTNAGYPPPEPYVRVSDPYEPFCIAAVELAAEQLVILGQCPAGVTVDDLRLGMEMELVLDTLSSDDDTDWLVWKWAPVGWKGSNDG